MSSGRKREATLVLSGSDDIEIVPSGEALAAAARLLGVEDVRSAFGSVASSERSNRSKYAGIGVKRQKHGLENVEKLECNLSRRIKKSIPGSSTPGSRRLNPKVSGSDHGDCLMSREDGSEDDEEGRGKVFERSKKKQSQTKTTTQQRAELLQPKNRRRKSHAVGVAGSTPVGQCKI